MERRLISQHPTEQQLKRHLTAPDRKTQQHVDSCLECQTALRLLRTTTQVYPGYEYDEPLIQRLTSLPAMARKVPARPQMARNIVDSWSSMPRASVRHAGYGVERRLRFQVAAVSIDLVVDKLSHQLECVLRISRRGRPLSGFVVLVNGRKLLPSDKGFFSWTATKPPAQILLWSSHLSITTGDIPW